MTDSLTARLRRAMASAAAGFSPAAPVGATRSLVSGRVRRRQRQVLALGMAAVVVLSAGAVGLATGGSSRSRSRQVVAQGAGPARADSATAPVPTIVGAGASGGAATSGAPTTSTGAIAPGTAGPPTSSAPVGGLSGTTTVPKVTGTTVPPAPVVTAPPTSASSGGTSQVRGSVLFGPVCPVEQLPPDPACAPRPGPAHIQLLRSDGTVAAQGDSGSDGQFSLAVPPGSYTVVAAARPPSAVGGGCRATPVVVSLAPGAVVTVDVSCDTGIR